MDVVRSLNESVDWWFSEAKFSPFPNNLEICPTLFPLKRWFPAHHRDTCVFWLSVMWTDFYHRKPALNSPPQSDTRYKPAAPAWSHCWNPTNCPVVISSARGLFILFVLFVCSSILPCGHIFCKSFCFCLFVCCPVVISSARCLFVCLTVNAVLWSYLLQEFFLFLFIWMLPCCHIFCKRFVYFFVNHREKNFF